MIYNDINESNYKFEYDKLTFYFSSKFYQEKFIKEYSEFIKNETLKLRLKYKCNVMFDEMILLLLYKNIEKRGFRVLYNNRELKENYYITNLIECSSYK